MRACARHFRKERSRPRAKGDDIKEKQNGHGHASMYPTHQPPAAVASRASPRCWLTRPPAFARPPARSFASSRPPVLSTARHATQLPHHQNSPPYAAHVSQVWPAQPQPPHTTTAYHHHRHRQSTTSHVTRVVVTNTSIEIQSVVARRRSTRRRLRRQVLQNRPARRHDRRLMYQIYSTRDVETRRARPDAKTQQNQFAHAMYRPSSGPACRCHRHVRPPTATSTLCRRFFITITQHGWPATPLETDGGSRRRVTLRARAATARQQH